MSDLRFAFRMLQKRPGFALAVIACLGLGIGANTAVFSVVDGVLLRPLVFPHADRLVIVRNVYHGEGKEEVGGASSANFLAWRERNRVFSEMALVDPVRNYNLAGEGEPERLEGAKVSRSLLTTLGIKPIRGRLFTAEEDRPGAPKVILVSAGLWARRFGSDPNLVGRTLRLNNLPYQVVGIIPSGLPYPPKTDLLAPFSLDPNRLEPWHDLDVVGRLRPGVTVERAQKDLSAISAQLERELPKTNAGWGARVLPLRELLAGDVRPALLALLSAVLFVLTISCANVANLQLARLAERDREIATRTALGAGQGQLARQYLVESLLLAVLGGVLGLALAAAALPALLALTPTEIRLSGVAIDARVLLFNLAVTLATGAALGLAPILRARRPDLAQLLREGAHGSTSGGLRSRLRSGLVVAEMALSLVLLVGAGLMLRSLHQLASVPAGFKPENVLTLRFNTPSTKYPEPAQRAAFFAQVLERVSHTPGVEQAGMTTTLPLDTENLTDRFTVEGRSVPPGNEPVANSRMVTPDYFKAMGIPLLRGRTFDPHDTAEAPPVAIVNETMARRYWPGEDPIGKRVHRGGPNAKRPWVTVVGVVADVREVTLAEEPGNTWYMPLAQNAWTIVALTVRTRADPAEIAASVRQAVWSIDRDLPVYDVATMDGRLASALTRPRFGAVLMTLFAGLALFLAALGIYGVLSYGVRQRVQEIGIRMALGASSGDVFRLILGQALRLVAIGLAVGLVAAFFLTRLLATQLYQVSASDPGTFVALAVTLTAVALLASFVPARRAVQVDPMTSLRAE